MSRKTTRNVQRQGIDGTAKTIVGTGTRRRLRCAALWGQRAMPAYTREAADGPKHRPRPRTSNLAAASATE